MSERTEIVKTCDVCGKRVSDEGQDYHEMPLLQMDSEKHPFNGWFNLFRLDSKNSRWDLCGMNCLLKLTTDRLSVYSKDTLL